MVPYKIMDITPISDIIMEFNITFNCKAIAVFVWLETIVNGHFNDNGMLLFPGSHSVIFYAQDNKTNTSVLKQTLEIYSLYEAGGFMYE